MKISVLIMKRKFRPHLKAKEESKSENHSVMSGLCDPMDYGILQARILEWVAFAF